MKVPNEIRQMWTDSYNLLVEVYKNEAALQQDGEAFFGALVEKMSAAAEALGYHDHANELLIAAYNQAERVWKGQHDANT